MRRYRSANCLSRAVLAAFLSVIVTEAATLEQDIAACKEGKTLQCYHAGKILTSGENGKVQEKRELGIGLLRKGCLYGDKRACDLLGMLYFDEKLYRAAHPYLKASCDANDSDACTALGTIYRDGHDVPQSDREARVYYTKACELGNADACFNVALIYSGGFGVARSRAESKRFYQKACQNGSKRGCEKYKKMDDADRGIETGIWERLRNLFK